MYYLLVDQYAHRAELFSRQAPKPILWIYQDFANLEETIELKALNIQIKLGELYEGVVVTNHFNPGLLFRE